MTPLLDEGSDEQRIILVSCMDFRKLWTIPFEEHRTKERIVHAPRQEHSSHKAELWFERRIAD